MSTGRIIFIVSPAAGVPPRVVVILEFVIATEQGVTDRLRRDYPEKTIIPIKNSLICPNMKMTSLEDIKEVLTNETNEIFVKEDIAKKAVRCIDRMMEASK